MHKIKILLSLLFFFLFVISAEAGSNSVIFNGTEWISQNGLVPDQNLIELLNSEINDGNLADIGTPKNNYQKSNLARLQRSANNSYGDLTFGSEVSFNSAETMPTGIVYDSNNEKIIIAYQAEDPYYGKAIVGTVSGMSISFGTAATFNSSLSDYMTIAYDANAQKVVIAYRDAGNSSYGTAIVGTVSGTSISFGSEAVFNSGTTTYTSIAYDANAQKVVIAYRDEGNSNYGTAIVGTVSGTSISFGSEQEFAGAISDHNAITYDSNAQKTVIAYFASNGYGIVGTISGTSISFGSATQYISGKSWYVRIAYDSDEKKVVLVYQGSSNQGKAIVGTVSGTSISFGSEVTFNAAETVDPHVAYDSDARRVIVTYRDQGNSHYGTAIVGTISGTSISFGGSEVVFNSGSSRDCAITHDANAQKMVIVYKDVDNSNYGTAIVGRTGYVIISGNSGFRMMSSPVAGTVYDDILGPLWIQGMTNGDDAGGTANVWTYDPSGSGSWDALSNLNTASLTAGQGFLVYIFSDVDNDGDNDLPVTLGVIGSENSATVSRSTTASKYNLLGNPFASTIDADQLFSDNGTTNWNSVVYVWNDAASDYYEWNGSAGDLSNGLIAPFQGFWVEAKSGGTAYSFTADSKTASNGTFYRSNISSAKFTVMNGNNSCNTYLTFNSDGSMGLDAADAKRLLPIETTDRLVNMFYVEDHALSINNLPYNITEDVYFDFDIMTLEANADSFHTAVDNIIMTWDFTLLPLDLSIYIHDMISDQTVDLSTIDNYSFSTVEKGAFSAVALDGVAFYPKQGDSRFILLIRSTSSTTEDEIIPNKFALHQNYPNPFNPVTTLRYDLPENGHINITIYDMLGRHVKTLINQTQDAGYRSVIWDATNDYGKPVSAGLYLYQIQAGEYMQTKKMVLLK